MNADIKETTKFLRDKLIPSHADIQAIIAAIKEYCATNKLTVTGLNALDPEKHPVPLIMCDDSRTHTKKIIRLLAPKYKRLSVMSRYTNNTYLLKFEYRHICTFINAKVPLFSKHSPYHLLELYYRLATPTLSSERAKHVDEWPDLLESEMKFFADILNFGGGSNTNRNANKTAFAPWLNNNPDIIILQTSPVITVFCVSADEEKNKLSAITKGVRVATEHPRFADFWSRMVEITIGETVVQLYETAVPYSFATASKGRQVANLHLANFFTLARSLYAGPRTNKDLTTDLLREYRTNGHMLDATVLERNRCKQMEFDLKFYSRTGDKPPVYTNGV